MRRGILAFALFIAACAHSPPALPVPTPPPAAPTPAPSVRAPCPNPADIPIVPRRVAADHPTMPRRPGGSVDWEAVSRILGAKVLELFAYAGPADAIMRTCAAPAP